MRLLLRLNLDGEVIQFLANGNFIKVLISDMIMERLSILFLMELSVNAEILMTVMEIRLLYTNMIMMYISGLHI